MSLKLKRVLFGLGVAAFLAGPATVLAQSDLRPERINGKPNLNGIWRAMGSAHWNLEAHSAQALEGFWKMGSLASIPAGRSVVVGGTIPYLPEALPQREENRANWPQADPEAACYLPGIPRATYLPYPWEIVQGDTDIFIAYAFASANRTIHFEDQRSYEEVPVDLWMGWSNGSWDGDTLVVETIANDDRTWLDRSGNYHSYMMTVTERFTPITPDHMQYEATIEDPLVFSRPWTIQMPLYRDVSENAELLDFKCVEFSENLLYGEFLLVPPE
ncbi:MAG: hypothetical protein R3305_03570 [Gammaproteobacteria bacterium]|nr:hypothetical protein [Gammaproteobacteria bacterium]